MLPIFFIVVIECHTANLKCDIVFNLQQQQKTPTALLDGSSMWLYFLFTVFIFEPLMEYKFECIYEYIVNIERDNTDNKLYFI